MPPMRFTLLIVAVIAAAAATIWLGTLATARLEVSETSLAGLSLILVGGYLIWHYRTDRSG